VLLEDWIRMDRLRPDPRTPVGYRRDGRPIFPMLGADPTDASNYLERIRGDRVLHEALTVGADPLHLALVFNLSHTAASRYATSAQNLLDDQMEVRQDAVGRESGRS
jgi:hypothetical protein